MFSTDPVRFIILLQNTGLSQTMPWFMYVQRHKALLVFSHLKSTQIEVNPSFIRN